MYVFTATENESEGEPRTGEKVTSMNAQVCVAKIHEYSEQTL
jgi:hypothetical protein